MNPLITKTKWRGHRQVDPDWSPGTRSHPTVSESQFRRVSFHASRGTPPMAPGSPPHAGECGAGRRPYTSVGAQSPRTTQAGSKESRSEQNDRTTTPTHTAASDRIWPETSPKGRHRNPALASASVTPSLRHQHSGRSLVSEAARVILGHARRRRYADLCGTEFELGQACCVLEVG